jgi:hypothetical protein
MMRTRTAVFYFMVLVTGAGCTFAAPERKLESTVHAQQDVAVTPNQLRLRMRSLVGPMCGEIEQAADQIIAGTTNDAVKQAALRWKIEGVPALRETLFEPDPFTAVMDTWVLSNQMTDYFERGPGKNALGESAVIAVAACRRMEEEFTRIVGAMTISGDVTKARAFARQWAAEHPIRHAIANRETALGRVLERDAASFYSTGEVVAEVTTAVDDLNRRLELYSDQLFRQVRWEAESFKSEILSDLKIEQMLPLAERAVNSVERTVATVDRLAPTVERALSVVEGTPKLLLSERDAMIKILQEELTRTIKFVQEERIVALEHLTKERIAALNEMREAVVEERKALTQDIEHLSLKVVDHAFWRSTQLLALLFVALFVVLVVAFFALKRSGPGRATTP